MSQFRVCTVLEAIAFGVVTFKYFKYVPKCSIFSRFYNSQSDLLLLWLFHNGFGSGCIRIAIANVVWFTLFFHSSFLLNRNDYFLSLKFQRLPFEWTNPIGYLLAILIQFIMLFFLNVYLACFLMLAFGYFLFALSIAKDMINELHSINKRTKMKKPKAQILKQLNDLISMHADVKGLSWWFKKNSKI